MGLGFAYTIGFLSKGCNYLLEVFQGVLIVMALAALFAESIRSDSVRWVSKEHID